MNGSDSVFKDEVRVSPLPLLAAIGLLGMAFTVVGDIGLSLICYALAVATGLLGRWRPSLGRWAAAIALLPVITLSAIRLRIPGTLALLAIPAPLAVSTVGLSAGMVVAVGASLSLLLVQSFAGTACDVSEVTIGLVAIWAVTGATGAVQLHANRLAQWSWEHFNNARRALDRIRDRQVELKQALDDLNHANHQLSLLNEKVASLRLLAEEAERAKAEFVAKVSHELRTPLNIIIGLTELMVDAPEALEGDVPLGMTEPLEIVYRNAQHLSGMINDVLDLSQVEAGRMALRREWVGFVGMIETALATVRPMVDAKDLYLRLDIPKNLPEVYCDRTRILQVIVNLVSNAGRFTEVGGITIRACEEDGYALVTVADTGPGIPSEDAERIFEPFCQGATKPWRYKNGSGLGLSISKQFIELHGGRIWVESKRGVGSSFHFKLPITPPEDPMSRSNRWIVDGWVDGRPQAKLPIHRLEQRAILCDETGELYPVLSRYSNEFEYVDTRNVPEATKQLGLCPAHLVIINASSPDELWPLLEKARQDMPDTPIVGWSCPARAAQVLSSHVSGYLTKPVRLSDLRDAFETAGKPVRRVLVVDDDADARFLFERVIRAIDSTIEVTLASGGREALETMRQEKPDLILLDIVMPEVDGWQVITAKNADSATRAIPVFLMSALDPTQEPLGSSLLVAAMGERLRLNQLIRCSHQIPKILLKAD